MRRPGEKAWREGLERTIEHGKSKVDDAAALEAQRNGRPMGAAEAVTEARPGRDRKRNTSDVKPEGAWEGGKRVPIPISPL